MDPASATFVEALALILEPAYCDFPDHDFPGVLAFKETAFRRGLKVELLCGAYGQGLLQAACLAVEVPGRSALVFLSEPKCEWSQSAQILALGELIKAACERSTVLIEALVEPNDASASRVLSSAGFRRLTQLLYYRRSTAIVTAVRPSLDLEWTAFEPSRAQLFETALQHSYLETLDCPELATVRTAADALAGHRACGEFDPSIWWVALHGHQPVGVLLLAPLPLESTIEVAYLGVAQRVRGTGVADALVDRAIRAARLRGAKHLTLAMDSRNAPAKRLYERYGFVRTSARDAWIVTPLHPRS